MYAEIFPYYLSLGCSYNEFWNETAYIAAAYREADVFRSERVNYELWLQGLYFYEALADVSPLFRDWVKDAKALPYASEPYALDQKTKEERDKKAEEETDKKNQATIIAWAKRANQIRDEKMKKGEKIDGR